MYSYKKPVVLVNVFLQTVCLHLCNKQVSNHQLHHKDTKILLNVKF